MFSVGNSRFVINIGKVQSQENVDNMGHPVYGAPLYLCTHRGGRRGVAGRGLRSLNAV